MTFPATEQVIEQVEKLLTVITKGEHTMSELILFHSFSDNKTSILARTEARNTPRR